VKAEKQIILLYGKHFNWLSDLLVELFQPPLVPPPAPMPLVRLSNRDQFIHWLRVELNALQEELNNSIDDKTIDNITRQIASLERKITELTPGHDNN
jgi:hypothetical protein